MQYSECRRILCFVGLSSKYISFKILCRCMGPVNADVLFWGCSPFTDLRRDAILLAGSTKV